MGWYYLAQDYFDSFGKLTCLVCKKDLKVGERVYFQNFEKGRVEHSLCAERVSEAKKENKEILDKFFGFRK